jgi:hypothetical protein
MPVLTAPDNQFVDYRYFVCDLKTNELLAEIPFRGVSYSRSLNEAGTFTGDIAITEDTFNLNLYENTLPGKTALYVVRNGICVWGGIVWSRSYSLIDKVLSVSASEFTSYFSHRVVWKTWNSSYEATAVVASGNATITLSNGQYNFQIGEAVWIDWGTTYAKYTGYFVVTSTSLTGDDRSIFTVEAKYFDATGSQKVMPNMTLGTDTPITVETRQDTYQYAKDLLEELKTDLYDFDFANDEIRPGIDLFNEINSVSRQNNVATITLTKKHEVVVGQKISVTDVKSSPGFNAQEAIVLSTPTSNSLTYASSGSNVFPALEETSYRYNISTFSRSNNIATYATTTSHDLGVGDIVYVENVSETFDGYFSVYEVPNSTSFRVVMFGINILPSTAAPAQTVNITGASVGAASITFTANNSFIPGMFVQVTGATPSSFNGDYIVSSRTNTTFTVGGFTSDTYSSGGTAKSEPPTVTRRASLTYGTFGEHTTSGDIGLEFTATNVLSQNLEANPIIRGFSLKTVAEILEDYSTKPNGFEYRIDCVYDQVSDSFKKQFKFLPLVPSELTAWLAEQGDGYTGAIPVSAYGADSLIFEYPGNILEANMEETAEDAGTRFFVQGKDPDLSSDASQPYSGASNHILLNDGWPILDVVDDLDSADETTLYKQAARLLEESVPPISTFTISINGSMKPSVGEFNPGDWCTVKLNDQFVSLRAASNLEQDYGTDSGALVRKILSFNINVPDTPSFPEEVDLELIIEPSIPISGVQIIGGKPFLGV